MNYYSFHIGDYAAHTQRLSLMEDLAYRRLMDAYYLAERPFNGGASDVAREIGMLDQLEAVSYVLSRFFNAVDDGFSNDRCEKEIAHYQEKKEQASNAGRASAAKRSNARSTNVEKTSTGVERSQEPLTNNQEPVIGGSAFAPPTTKPAKPIAVEKPDDVDQQVWSDWLTLRKAKKAPATQTVVNSAITEADKAGMPLNDFLAVWCARGSQGLEASWLKPDERNHGKPSRQAETFAERDERLAADRIAAICPSIAAKPINRNRDVIDITPRRFGALS